MGVVTSAGPGWSVLLLVVLTFTLGGLDSDLLVILLEGGKILSGLGEFTFLHTFTDVPMDEGSLGVHKIELMIDSGEDLSDGGGVGDHAHGSHDLGEVTSGHDSGGLIVDTALEASGAPVDELDGSLGLDGGNGGVDVLGDNVTSVHHAAGHVFTMSGVALGHHGGGLESGIGDLSDRELLVVGLLSRDDGSVGREHEMNTGIGHEVGLELGDIDVEGTIEPKGGSQSGDNLRDKPVEVGVGGPLDVEGSPADIVDGLVVKHDSDIGVLKKRVSGQDRVVWLNNSGGDLGRGVDGEAKLGLLAMVDGEPLKKERSETGAGTTTDGVEDEEALETGALVSKFPDSVEAEVDDFLTD